MIWVIVGLALAALGVIVIVFLQMPQRSQKKLKKKNEPLPEPPTDWKTIAERLEKRLHTMEKSLSASLDEVKVRDKKINELDRSAAEIRKQFDQEKAWREKGEALAAKEKKQEKLLQEELEKTRADLNRESTQRIKQEYELKELRQAREELTAQERKLSSHNMQLERSLADALKENKNFKEENFQLKKKKEGEEWVAKSDYRRLDGLLKRARWEVEQFKKKIPVGQWPRALQPKAATRPRQDGEKSSDQRPVELAVEPALASPVVGEPKAAEGPGISAETGSAAPVSETNSSSQGV